MLKADGSFDVRLLNRDQVTNEEATVDDEEDDGFLKAFKVYYSPLCFFVRSIGWL